MSVYIDSIILHQLNGLPSKTTRRIKTFSTTKQNTGNICQKRNSEEFTSNPLEFRKRRLDKYGTEIKKGLKLHKVTFADQFNNILVDRENIEINKEVRKEQTIKFKRGSCLDKCTIF